MKQSEFYRKRALITESNWVRINIVLDLIKECEANAILDVGCGDGTVTTKIAELAHTKTVGIDVSIGALHISHGFSVCGCDVERGLPIADNSFDVCHLGEIIEHVFDTDFLLSEIWRVLKPGGCCIVTTPNLGYWINRLLLVFGIQPLGTEVSLQYYGVGNPFVDKNKHIPAGHIRAFTLTAFNNLAEVNGFRCEATRASPKLLQGAIGIVDRFIAKLFPGLGGHMIVKIRKES